MKKNIFILAGILLLSLSVTAQKNAVYGTLGFYTSLNYERTFLHSEEKGNKLGLRAHGGKLFALTLNEDEDKNNEYKYNLIGLTAVGLLGNNRSFFEGGLGGAMFFEDKNDGEVKRTGFLPNLTLGYRYEFKPVVIRAGVGFPELVYFSAGVRF